MRIAASLLVLPALGLALGCVEAPVRGGGHGKSDGSVGGNGGGGSAGAGGNNGGSGGGGSGGASDAGSGADASADKSPPADAGSGAEAAPGSCGAPPDLPTMCPGIMDVKAFHAWMNKQRDSYGGVPPYGYHDRWKGIPWKGTYHMMDTFPLHFAWDDALACKAQAEADRIAKGGKPTGTAVEGQNGCCGYMWIDGLNTADWKITARQKVDAKGKDIEFGLGLANGSARMALHYHDFGGDGPVIKKVGVGGAVGADCLVHWVLQFGP